MPEIRVATTQFAARGDDLQANIATAEAEQRIRYIRNKIPELKFHKAPDTLADWEQMLLMSSSTHNIIANSSFSWWSAYLNNYENKVVCYPNKWFGKKLAHNNTKDMFIKNWNCINISS